MAASRLIRFVRFAMVGCLGFAVDAAFVFGFIYWLGGSQLWSRFPAWLIAVSVTYSVNLAFTFRQTKAMLLANRYPFQRYVLYVASQGMGGAVNIATYLAVVLLLKCPLVVALGLGTTAGLIFNFIGASLVVNRGR